MVYVGFRLGNPFSNHFKNFFCVDRLVSTNKSLVVELTYSAAVLFEAEIQWSIRCDHAGPRIEVVILGLGLHLNLYDKRHWNYDANRWMIEGDDDEDE